MIVLGRITRSPATGGRLAAGLVGGHSPAERAPQAAADAGVGGIVPQVRYVAVTIRGTCGAHHNAEPATGVSAMWLEEDPGLTA